MIENATAARSTTTTAAEIQTWSGQIQAGTLTLDELAQRLLASAEFYQLTYINVV
jgi:hypothetical protein